MIQALSPREMRGKEISEMEGQISRVTDYYYSVRSQRETRKVYFVERKEFGWTCTCPDQVFRRIKCKHIYAVEFSRELRKVVEVRKIEPISTDRCIFCKSQNIRKYGVKHNQSADLQVYLCKDCGKHFTHNIGFEKMKHNPQAITSAMQLYFSGESLRNVCKSLRLLGVQVSHMSIYRWIAKYTELMGKYLDQITPQVSNTWRADEVYVKVKGDMKYLFALMDDQTRFWIAQEVADTKFTHDAQSLFKMGKESMGKSPGTLITDGLPAYRDAFDKEFWTMRVPRAKHIREIALAGQIHNNKMERLNGEIRDREKTMRGLKIKETPILKGMQLFHNYIRPHESLSGNTPAEACGIEITGQNKWKTIIQNARKSQSQ